MIEFIDFCFPLDEYLWNVNMHEFEDASAHIVGQQLDTQLLTLYL